MFSLGLNARHGSMVNCLPGQEAALQAGETLRGHGSGHSSTPATAAAAPGLPAGLTGAGVGQLLTTASETISPAL